MVISRCGFNSKGHKHVKQRLEDCDKKGVLGVNLGKNKESESAEDDYVKGIMEFSLVADYFTINVSSPNTPGLRSLQKRQALEKLLDKVWRKSYVFQTLDDQIIGWSWMDWKLLDDQKNIKMFFYFRTF